MRPCGVPVRASLLQLVPGSAAANSPLQCGQVLKSINGIDCSHCSTDDLADLLLGPEGSLVRVQTIGRGGLMKSVNLERGLSNNGEHAGQATWPHRTGHADCGASGVTPPVLGMQIPRHLASPLAHFEHSTSLNLPGSGGEGDRFGRLGADSGLFGDASIQKERTRLEQHLQALGGMEQTMTKASLARSHLQMPGGRVGAGSFGQGAMPQENDEMREVQI